MTKVIQKENHRRPAKNGPEEYKKTANLTGSQFFRALRGLCTENGTETTLSYPCKLKAKGLRAPSPPVTVLPKKEKWTGTEKYQWVTRYTMQGEEDKKNAKQL